MGGELVGWAKCGRLACNVATTRGSSCRLLLLRRWLPCLAALPCPSLPAACRLQALLPLGRQHLGSRAVAWFGLGLAAALLLTSDVMLVGGATGQGAAYSAVTVTQAACRPWQWLWVELRAADVALPVPRGSATPPRHLPISACSCGWAAAAATPTLCMA